MKKIHFKVGFVSVLAISIVSLGGILFHTMSGNQTNVAELKTQLVMEDIYDLSNEQRSFYNSPNLLINTKLMEAAQKKANDMASKGYFAHTDPIGRKFNYWIRLAGYDYSYAAENLAVRFLSSDKVVTAWMNSPSHRKSLLSDKYSEVGIGIALGEYKGDKAFFVVMLLAEPTIPLKYQYLFKN